MGVREGSATKIGVRSVIGILDRRDKQKIAIVCSIQILFSLMDLVGVLAIGLLGVLSVSGLNSEAPVGRTLQVLEVLKLENESFQFQAFSIALIAVFMLIGRTLLSIFTTRRILFFMSARGARLSASLISRLLAQPLLKIESRTSQEILFSVTTGVSLITLEVLAPIIVLVSDVALLFVMAGTLFVIDPSTAFGTFAMFAVIAYSLHRVMHIRAGILGRDMTELIIKSNGKIVEVFSSYREALVRNRREFYASEIGLARFSISKKSAELYFLPYISKYVIEIAVILGAILVAAFQFIIGDAVQAISTMAVFLVAGTRVAPAILRIQQGLVSIKRSLGESTPTIDLIESLENYELNSDLSDVIDFTYDGFSPEVEIVGVSLTYPNASIPAISEVSFKIPPGKSAAFVGISGAGKTTIVDVLLGVLKPDSGTVKISGMPPLDAIKRWPGAISYVPQDITIVAGTFRENVALGFPSSIASDDLVISALKVAHLDEFVLSLPNGIDTEVGERGTRLSGGQRQRLGIARAMFTNPRLLVLDEATSSLDGISEASISEAIHELRGSTSVIVIAHRLSTIKNVDSVMYMKNGKILSSGTFEQIRESIPEFDQQAKHMGL